MKWLLIVATVWYWWRVYSLSFNPDEFPDRRHAHSVWDRRSHRSFVLGAAIATAFLFVFGIVHSWWATAITFAVSLLVLVFAQPTFVAGILFIRAGLTILKVKAGIKVGTPFLAPFAWTYYLTEEEKKKALDERPD